MTNHIFSSSDKRKAFNHVGHFVQEDLEELKIAGSRYYRLADIVLPSVTTVLSSVKNEGLEAWRDSIGHDVANYIARTAAKTGTDFHRIAQDYLSNKDTDLHRDMLYPFAHFDLIRDDLGRIDNIHALEATLYSTRLGIAGRVDIVAEFDGILSVIDLKSARRKKQLDILNTHAIQETAYAACWTERTGIPIKQIVTIVSCQNGMVQTVTNDPADFESVLEKRIEEFKVSEAETLGKTPKGFPGISTKLTGNGHD